MAIGLPPETSAQLSEADAEALFEEAREIERRRRRHRLAGASVIAGLALAAGIGFGVDGGGGASIGRHGSGSGRPAASGTPQQRILTGTGAVSTSVCMKASQPASPGDPPPGQCVVELPNGQRYRCPIGVEHSFGAGATQAIGNSACQRLAPPTIPASWRPSVRQMHRVEACLQRAGLTASGGAIPPNARRAYPDTPIASVMIVGAGPTTANLTPNPTSTRPTIVSFYLTPAQARQAYERTLPTVTRQGQGMALRGRVLYTWNSQPAGEAGTERGCLQAA